MNAYVPFICLAAGALINWKGLPEAVLKIFDILTNMALVVLMLVIGLNIGISREVMDNLGKIGFNCIIISISAILCSVILVVLAEHTVMPLKKIRLKLSAERPAYEEEKNEPHFSALIIIMPLCIAIGILSGKFLLSETDGQIIDATLTVSLIFLYTGVGVSIGSNKEVFSYIRKLGFRIIFMPDRKSVV